MYLYFPLVSPDLPMAKTSLLVISCTFYNNSHFSDVLNHFYCKGLFPYYIISYNKQGSFQMIIEDYNKGPRVVRKDYVL